MGVALGVIIHLVIVYLGGDKIHNKMDAVSHPTNRLDNYPAKRKDYKSTERVGALKFLVNTNWFYLWFVRCVSLWL